VGSVFFESKKIEQWSKSFLFLISAEGILLFPLVMLLSYFDLSMKSATIYALVVIILVKILTFYKTFLIFFQKKGRFLQNILYLCALEIVPLFLLGGALTLINSFLKVNF
jgi:hypothetical protein